MRLKKKTHELQLHRGYSAIIIRSVIIIIIIIIIIKIYSGFYLFFIYSVFGIPFINAVVLVPITLKKYINKG